MNPFEVVPEKTQKGHCKVGKLALFKFSSYPSYLITQYLSIIPLVRISVVNLSLLVQCWKEQFCSKRFFDPSMNL